MLPEEAGGLMRRLTSMFEEGLEPPGEDEVTKVAIEEAPQAYRDAIAFSGEKKVIVFR